MARYLITGGKKLEGEIKISGNKNSILPCLAACLLTKEEVFLRNVPKISDVEVLIEILVNLGVKVEISDHGIRIKATKIETTDLPESLTNKLRGSILLAGALLGREGKVSFFHPGGDIIGKRSINLHLEGFEQMGYKVGIKDRHYKIGKFNDKKEPVKIYLSVATVTGTENLVLAAVLRPGITIIRNAAQEPHVADLCHMLEKMGAKIEGIGTSELKITGVKKLDGTDFKIGSDFMEFGTYAVAAAITGGDIKFRNFYNLDIDPIVWVLSRMGVVFKISETTIEVSAKKLKSIHSVVTNVWPGFPTDLMSVLIVLATQAKGASLMHDWIYESRMFFVDKLISMGANITIADPHRVLVYGPTKLSGREVETPDIRAGMALVLAALVAHGKSVINRAELIERGYEDVVANLTRLGAEIERIG